MDKKIYKSKLKKDHYFTEKMIDELLPEPEIVYLNAKQTRYVLLWDMADVEEAKKTDRYKTRLEKIEKKKVTSSGAVNVFNSLPEIIFYDDVPKDRTELAQIAMEHYSEYRQKYVDVSAVDEWTLNRWIVNYIRHEKTNYDEILKSKDFDQSRTYSLQYKLYQKLRKIFLKDYPYLIDALDSYLTNKS